MNFLGDTKSLPFVIALQLKFWGAISRELIGIGQKQSVLSFLRIRIVFVMVSNA